VVLAGANLLLHSTSLLRRCEHLGAGEDAPPFARFVAASSILLWTSVIVLGRYMPLFEDTLDPRF
jgi:hypothetical protein